MNTETSAPTAPPRRSWRSALLRVLRVAALTYLGILLVLLLLENSMVYHPSGSGDFARPPAPEVRDVEITSADGTRIHGWWWPHPRATGALLYFHGNAGNLSHRGDIVADLRETLGVSVLIIDYPGYGKSSGSPSEAGCLAAADAAYDWLTKQQQIAPGQILLFGKSLGGGVAVDLASRRDHRALILVKTFTSMPDVGADHFPWLPVRWLMRNRYESLGKMAACKRPVFIAHGDTDTLIPYQHGKRLFEAANEPKHFFTMPGNDHNDPPRPEFFRELRAFLARVEAK